jgi:hypothetical protein
MKILIKDTNGELHTIKAKIEGSYSPTSLYAVFRDLQSVTDTDNHDLNDIYELITIKKIIGVSNAYFLHNNFEYDTKILHISDGYAGIINIPTDIYCDEDNSEEFEDGSNYIECDNIGVFSIDELDFLSKLKEEDSIKTKLGDYFLTDSSVVYQDFGCKPNSSKIITREEIDAWLKIVHGKKAKQ